MLPNLQQGFLMGGKKPPVIQDYSTNNASVSPVVGAKKLTIEILGWGASYYYDDSDSSGYIDSWYSGAGGGYFRGTLDNPVFSANALSIQINSSAPGTNTKIELFDTITLSATCGVNSGTACTEPRVPTWFGDWTSTFYGVGSSGGYAYADAYVPNLGGGVGFWNTGVGVAPADTKGKGGNFSGGAFTPATPGLIRLTWSF